MSDPSGNLYGRVWGESPPEPLKDPGEGTDASVGEAGPAAGSSLTRDQLEALLLRIESRLVTLETQVRITNRSLATISDRLLGRNLPPDSIWNDIQRADPPRQ